MLSATIAAALLLAASPPAPGCFPREARLDDFQRDWFCKQLSAAREGMFVNDPGFRFVWIPTFRPTRIVEVHREGQAIVVTGKVLGGAGGYEPGELVRSTRRELKPEEWRLLQERFENAGLWEDEGPPEPGGVDGSQWVVEARRSGKYVVRVVWSPRKSTFPQYRKACEYMLTLAGIHPGADALP